MTGSSPRISMLADLRTFPRMTRWLLGLNMVNNLGTGLVVPFLVIYVHEVRGLPLSVATTAVAIAAAAVVLGSPVIGLLADRRGAPFASILSLCIQVVGLVVYAFADHAWQFWLAALLVGLGGGGGAAWASMLARSAPPAVHPAMFSLNFAGANVAIGLGAVAGSLVTRVDHSWAFPTLYVADAVTCLAVAAVVLLLRERLGATPTTETRAEAAGTGSTPAAGGGYGVVLAHRGFVALIALGTVLFCAAYSQLESGLPVYLTTNTEVLASHFGVLFAVNTAVVVVSQLVLHPLLRATAPTRLAAAAATLWALSWVLVLVSSTAPAGAGQFGVLAVGFAVFAVAETCYAAGMPSLVNAMATEEARGRYNAAYGSATGFGFVVGPLLAGAFAADRSGHWFFAVAALACLATAAVLLAGRRTFAPRPAPTASVDAALPFPENSPSH